MLVPWCGFERHQGRAGRKIDSGWGSCRAGASGGAGAGSWRRRYLGRVARVARAQACLARASDWPGRRAVARCPEEGRGGLGAIIASGWTAFRPPALRRAWIRSTRVLAGQRVAAALAALGRPKQSAPARACGRHAFHSMVCACCCARVRSWNWPLSLNSQLSIISTWPRPFSRPAGGRGSGAARRSDCRAMASASSSPLLR